MMTDWNNAAQLAVSAAEAGRIPDPVIRYGMRKVIERRLRNQEHTSPKDRERFRREAWSGPIALSPDHANEQHYEIPAAFFEIILGARGKYSSGYWPDEDTGLDDAEAEMFGLYADRADLIDGQRILDLGCGWGSFSLWAAEQFPNSEIVGVSNSRSQAFRIRQLAAGRGLANVEAVTSDINHYTPADRFDRIVSIEMLEHVRNHRALFEKLEDWVESDGAVFTHVFAHKNYFYPFELDGPGSWMARTFFTGGIMPSGDLLQTAAAPFFDKEGEWWVDGTHYSRTLESWLSHLDAETGKVREILEPVYGADVDVWIQRWRMFFMACSEMFAMHDGKEWGVLHQLFRPR